MKQKVFSWKDKFNIYDEFGNEAYSVEGKVFSIGKKLDIFDMHNTHKAHIHQKVLSFLPRYFIQMNGEDVAEVVKHFTLFTQKFSVTGYDWQVDGDFLAHEYEIYRGDYSIATISKEWFTFGDAYQIQVADHLKDVFIVAIVLVIDACIQAQRND